MLVFNAKDARVTKFLIVGGNGVRYFGEYVRSVVSEGGVIGNEATSDGNI